MKMNKRKAKKYRRKIMYPYIDEFNLLTLSPEELKEARKEYEEYCFLHRHYKHYKDRDKIKNKPCLYSFPVGRAVRDYYEKMAPLARTYNAPVKVTPTVDLKRPIEALVVRENQRLVHETYMLGPVGVSKGAADN